jgi:hypothetical protein
MALHVKVGREIVFDWFVKEMAAINSPCITIINKDVSFYSGLFMEK